MVALLSGHSVSSWCTGLQLVSQAILGLDRAALLGIVAQTLERSATAALTSQRKDEYYIAVLRYSKDLCLDFLVVFLRGQKHASFWLFSIVTLWIEIPLAHIPSGSEILWFCLDPYFCLMSIFSDLGSLLYLKLNTDFQHRALPLNQGYCHTSHEPFRS